MNDLSISEILENYEKTLDPKDEVIVTSNEKTIIFHKTGMNEEETSKLTQSLTEFLNSEESNILKN